MSRLPPDLCIFATRWVGWVDDPMIRRAGITFDRTPAPHISAPPGQVRVCAYHVDFDERPTCYQDVDSLQLAGRIIEHFHSLRSGWNVDYACAYDETGHMVAGNRPY